MSSHGGLPLLAANAPSEGELGQERITKAPTGTLRTNRLKGIAANQLDVASSPDGVSSRAAAEWKQVSPLVVSLSLLTASDLRALELLVETLATEEA